MKTPQIVIAFVAFIASLPLFAEDAGTNTAAQITEEARKNFIIGTTLFKDAKTPDDFSQAIRKFKQ
jgi:hypothetical protein